MLRLLTFSFRADMVLPPGFDLVVLGKKEKENVIAVGKNPERKESDVDENGKPINTEYRGDPGELVLANQEEQEQVEAPALPPQPPAEVPAGPSAQYPPVEPQPQPQPQPQQQAPMAQMEAPVA